MIAGLRRRRRTLLRHGREMIHVNAWLALVEKHAATDPALALELLKCRRLVKGYSDTHARGQSKFDRVIAATDRLAGRADAADWIRRLRDAALADEEGTTLDGALGPSRRCRGGTMGRYRGNLEAVRSLVREGEVHRDVYTDPEIFALEMEQLFANTWVYVGHASQVPNAGDFFTTTIGTQPVVMTRHTDGSCPRPAQPLPAQGHEGRERVMRQHRAPVSLPVSRLGVPHRRQAAFDTPAQRLRQYRLRAGRRRGRA